MDIITQLQEQLSKIASLTFNTIGTLPRDAPPNQLSPDYPDAPPNLVGDPAAVANASQNPHLYGTELIKATKQFDAMLDMLELPEGGEEAQLKRIAELQAENDAIGLELKEQMEAAEKELRQVQELFGQATDSCFALKKPETE